MLITGVLQKLCVGIHTLHRPEYSTSAKFDEFFHYEDVPFWMSMSMPAWHKYVIDLKQDRYKELIPCHHYNSMCLNYPGKKIASF